MELWWVGPNGSVKDADWDDGQGWNEFELAPAGSASTSTDIAAVSRIPGSMEVWWVGPDESAQDACFRTARMEPVPAGPGSGASTTSGIAAGSRIQNSMEVGGSGQWIGAGRLLLRRLGRPLANPAASTGYSPAPAERTAL